MKERDEKRTNNRPNPDANETDGDRSGDTSPDRPAGDDSAKVDEESEQSFPASDPPAW